MGCDFWTWMYWQSFGKYFMWMFKKDRTLYFRKFRLNKKVNCIISESVLCMPRLPLHSKFNVKLIFSFLYHRIWQNVLKNSTILFPITVKITCINLREKLIIHTNFLHIYKYRKALLIVSLSPSSNWPIYH